MQLKRVTLGLAGAALLVAGSALAQKVTTDYQKTVDFSRYKTYMWIMQPRAANPLTRERIIDDVNSALGRRGLTLVTGNADVTIAAHAATRQERTLNTFYSGLGGGWRWGGLGSATTTVDTYEVGTLIVDVFDASTKEAIWRGVATKTLSDNPRKNADSLNKAIDKMFEKFPPQTAHETTRRD